MIDRFHFTIAPNRLKKVIVYWYDRPATLQEAVFQFRDFLVALKNHNPPWFSTWYRQAYTRREALKHQVHLDEEASLKQLFEEPDEEEPDENEDAHLESSSSHLASVWNGAKKEREGMSVMVSLGGTKGVYLSNVNYCELTLPDGGAFYDAYCNPAQQQALIRFLERYWSPDYTMITTNRIEVEYACGPDAASNMGTWLATGEEDFIGGVINLFSPPPPGHPIEWHFRYPSVLKAIKRILERADLKGADLKDLTLKYVP